MRKRRINRNQFLPSDPTQVKVAVRKSRSSVLIQKLADHPGIIAIVLALLVTYLFSSLLSVVSVVDLSAGNWALFG